MADSLSTVYGKREGSGGAYILPNNQAASIFVSGLSDMREKERILKAAQLKRQQGIDDANATTLGSLKPVDHWGEKSAEIQQGYNAVADYGLNATQNGININTDRNFLKMRNDIIAKAGATKDLQKLYEQNYTEVGKNPDAYENGIDVLKSIRGASLDDFQSGKFKPEPLRKIYSLADAVKESAGTTSYVKNNDGTFDTTKVNRSGNVGQALSSLSTPSAKYLINKAGGDIGPYISGFPTVTPDGKTYFNTEGKQFEDAVIQKLATDPNLPSYLQSKGYDVSTTDNIRKSAMNFAKKQNQAAGNYVKDYADVLENKATTDTTRIFAAEANRRANRGEQRSEESHKVAMNKAADAELAKNPNSIVSNVVTNISSTQTGPGSKVVTRPSTSYAAANVGNAKSSFIPLTVYDPETGLASANSGSINVSGGQVHIKPVLRFGGTEKILDDESLKKIKEGTYKVNGKIVPANASINYDELLYGEERVPAVISAEGIQTKPSTVRKLIIPVTGQALDKKFDKGYNRVQMWEKAISTAKDFDTKMGLIKQHLKIEAPGISEKELDKIAFETAKQY